MSRGARFAGIIGAVLFVAAVVGFGTALDGYLQSQHPVALLGAKDFPHALAFNLLAFVLPGMLAGVVAMTLRHRLPADAGWTARIGAQLVFLSALAFIAMGLLPLDANDLESDASRLHGTAWMLWAVAFVSAAALLASGLWRDRQWSRFARLSLAAALGVLVAAFVQTDAIPAGVAQRIAFGIWFAWLTYADASRRRYRSGPEKQ
ncbi:DUF998 domain-containing protein [Pseudoxanthomonas sacheonensis]|uniref:Membrane protein n=1 Tax=Pseudoxanthomonas sacheonensis TaxID=443615 RepID=A0ABU1RN04_9GAMM|nr:DUF998 domain-containing protein [Pseudoxanthomonas sacheonensis]MDR6840159.1 putative membrane protein [Pseudoxanthomonas sacheonensis]